MTLILTCLAKDYVVQASDRRLSYWDGKKVVIDDDDSNKVLIYENRFVFAYTGLAKLPVRNNGLDTNQSAIDWAAEQLSKGKNLEDAVHYLKNRVTDLMNTNRIRKFRAHDRWLAFVGAGFDEIETGEKRKRRALRIVISNFIEEDGTLLNQPRDVFSVQIDPLPENRRAELLVAGQRLSLDAKQAQERKALLTDILKRCFKRKKGAETVGIILTQEILAVAKENEYVGSNIMCTFMPRASRPFDGRMHHIGGIPFQFNSELHQFEPVEVMSLRDRFVILPPFDDPRIIYVSEDNKSLPYHTVVHVSPGNVNSPISIHNVSVTPPPFHSA
jgi:hypothetical protein